MSDPQKDLLVIIKKARLAGFVPKRDQLGLCLDLHKLGFIGRERVVASGKSPTEEDKTNYRFYIKPKGNRYLGVYGSAVPDILYRGGSCPVGMDRHGRACSHMDGVFLSKSKEVAMFFATRFSKDSPVIQECQIAIHTLLTVDGEGKTSPELGLNHFRSRHVNVYDGAEVLRVHQGYFDEHKNRTLTEEHKEHNVPKLCDFYIVFNVWDVYPLNGHTDVSEKPLYDAPAASTSEIDTLTVPSFAKR